MSRLTDLLAAATPLPWLATANVREVYNEVCKLGNVATVYSYGDREDDLSACHADTDAIEAIVNAAPDIQRLWEAARSLSYSDKCQHNGEEWHNADCLVCNAHVAVEALRPLCGGDES